MIICNFCKKEYEDCYIVNGLCLYCSARLNRIPEIYKSCSFDNFILNTSNREALALARRFHTTKRGLYLYGTVGSGKTHLAISILKDLISKGKSVNMVIIPDLLMSIRDSFKTGNSLESDLIELYKKGYLLFDDLGSEKITDFSVQMIYKLFNRRYIDNQHNIIITSNLSLKELAESMNDRIASRIAGMCDIIQINDKDYRLKTKKSL